jgi:hypothetical protein
MASFSDNMMAFTDRLKASIDDRAESLAGIRQDTADLIDTARKFMDDVALGHELRADEINAFLAKSHADRCEMVQAMREMHRDELASMSDEMRRMLDENRKSRCESVADFMSTSRADRLESAKAMHDCHRAELDAMSEELHHRLDDANKSRLETVGMMRKTFQEAQHSLATDLRSASTTWREFVASR